MQSYDQIPPPAAYATPVGNPVPGQPTYGVTPVRVNDIEYQAQGFQPPSPNGFQVRASTASLACLPRLPPLPPPDSLLPLNPRRLGPWQSKSSKSFKSNKMPQDLAWSNVNFKVREKNILSSCWGNGERLAWR